MEYSVAAHNNGGKCVTLLGQINEDADIPFQNLIAELKDVTKVTFNFSQVKSVNSLGVRAWVSFLRVIEDGRETIFEECTPDVIMQINMIPSFLSKGKVDSFYVNYICDVCNKSEKVLVTTKDLKPKSIPQPPKCEADECGMQTEELEEEYFLFLTK